MGGILKGEGALELSCTNLELLVLHPFSIEVYQLYCRLTGSFGISTLDLGAPVEVADLAVQDETGQTKVEGIGVGSFLVNALVL